MKWPKYLESRSPRERGMVVALGVLAILGIGFLIRQASSGTAPFPPLPQNSIRASATPTPLSTLPQTPSVFGGKDPFQPLVTTASGGGGGSTPTPGPTGGPTGGGSNPSGQSHRVTLVDVFTRGGERMATVEVDGTQYTVHVGDTFATNYRLLSLTASCGTFVFGDERFTLCIGQEVRK